MIVSDPFYFYSDLLPIPMAATKILNTHHAELGNRTIKEYANASEAIAYDADASKIDASKQDGGSEYIWYSAALDKDYESTRFITDAQRPRKALYLGGKGRERE